MASSGSVNSSKYGQWYLQLNWTQTSKNSQTNKSTISWNVKTIRASGSGSYYVGNISAVINGVTVYSCDNSNRWLMSNGAVVASGTTEITHNNDGTKSFSASIKGAIYTYADNVSGSGSFTLDTIPRYASISQSLASRTENSITVSWSADATCDYLWYSIDNGANFTGVQIADSTSGSYAITGLNVGTSYDVITRVKRKDSQLTSQTSAQAMSTYPKPYASVTPDFVLGNRVVLNIFNPLTKSIRASFLDCNGNAIATIAGAVSGDTAFFDPNMGTWTTQIDALYASIPNATSGIYSIKVENMDDPTDYTVTQGGSYSVNPADCLPEIGIATYEDTNPNTTAVILDNSKIVQNLSTVRYIANNLQAKKSASVESVSVAVLGQTYNLVLSGSSASGGNGTINSSADVVAVFTITDSRGLTNTKECTVTMLAWRLPTALVSVGRVSNFYSTTDMLVDADYPSLDGKNTITITYLGKAVPQTGQTTPSDVSGSLQDNTTGQDNFDNNFEWNISFTLRDAFNATATYNAYIARGMPIVYFDRMKRSVGINGFPEHEESIEIFSNVGNFYLNGNPIGVNIFDLVYPIGTIYTTISTIDPSTIFGGTWQKIGAGRTLFGASNDAELGTTVESGLPNLYGNIFTRTTQYQGSQIMWNGDGLFQHTRLTSGGDVINQSNNPSGNNNNYHNFIFDASRYNSIYGNSNIVQPPAIYVYFWQRIA